MKKYLLTLSALISMHVVLKAQDDIYGGFKLSTNYSFFSSPLENPQTTKSINSRFGYGIGYYETVELSNRINLQVEFNFNSFGFSRRDTVEFTPPIKYSKEIIRIRTFEVPLMMKYRVSDALALGAGYQFGFLSTGKKKSIDKDGNEQLEEFTSENDVATTSGIVIDANYNKNKLMFGLRFLLSNNPLQSYKYQSKNAVNEINSNMNLSLYVGYKLFN